MKSLSRKCRCGGVKNLFYRLCPSCFDQERDKFLTDMKQMTQRRHEEVMTEAGRILDKCNGSS